MNKDTQSTYEQDMDPRTDLAVERTELALERTHLAWIRTMFTIITAGLAIDKVFEALHRERLIRGTALIGPSHVSGLILISFGIIMMSIETWQYIKRSRELAAMKVKGKSQFFTATVMGILVIIIGIVFCGIALAT